MSESAWAAGFFDGEGCVRANRPKKNYKPFLHLCVTQADRRPLDRFVAAVGDCKVYGPYDQHAGKMPNARPCYQIQVGGRRAWPILIKLWPHLSEPKREAALDVIKRLYRDRKAFLQLL